jgi:hypothetical protein
MEWALLTFTLCAIAVAGFALRWWRRVSKLDYRQLEKELIGDESFHVLPHKRIANAEAIKSRLALLVVLAILVACVLSWKTLQAFLV